MYCTQCGSKANPEDRYCSSCGRLLDGSEAGISGGPGAPGPAWSGRGAVGERRGLATAEPALVPASEAELATFGRRAAGLGIDLLGAAALAFAILIVLSIIAVVADPDIVDREPTDAESERLAVLWFGTLFGLWFAFTWWFNALGWTLGKRAMGLRIIREDGSPPGAGAGMGRTFGAWLSWLAVGLGFLWAAWDEQQQTWHDKMAGTYVVMADSLRRPR